MPQNNIGVQYFRDSIHSKHKQMSKTYSTILTYIHA